MIVTVIVNKVTTPPINGALILVGESVTAKTGKALPKAAKSEALMSAVSPMLETSSETDPATDEVAMTVLVLMVRENKTAEPEMT